MAQQDRSHERIASGFRSAVNMAADELGDWLKTDQSKTVGLKRCRQFAGRERRSCERSAYQDHPQ